MNRADIFLCFIFVLVSSAVLYAQEAPPVPKTIDGVSTKDLKTPMPPQEKKSSKAKKSKGFDPPPEGPGGVPGFVLEGAPPPPARSFPLEAWKEKVFSQEQFAISFPTQPNEETKPDTRGAGTITKVYEVITMDGTYSVTSIKLPSRSSETKEELKQRLRSMLKQLETGPYKWISGKEIEANGYPGVEFKYKTPQPELISWQKFMVVDNYMFRVVAETIPRSPELKEPQLFMDSFKLLPREKHELGGSIPPPPPPAAGQSLGGTPRPITMRVSGGVLNGNAIKKVQPGYPREALAARATGAVQVAITVSEEGKVIEANAVSGHDLLREAAVNAARQWTFKQTEISGVPVRVQGILTFNFTLQ